MENQINYGYIIEKLNNGIKFGLFEDGAKCYFRDGEQVSYTALWKAIRTINDLPDCHHKTISKICPDNFAGTFTHKYSKHNWKTGKARKTFRHIREIMSKVYWEIFMAEKLSFKTTLQLAGN